MDHNQHSYTNHGVFAVFVTIAVATIAVLISHCSGLASMNSSAILHHVNVNANAPCISTFQVALDDPVEIAASKLALSLIQSAYHQDYCNSSISHHHFVRMAPSEIQEQLSMFVWTDSHSEVLMAMTTPIPFIPSIATEVFV